VLVVDDASVAAGDRELLRSVSLALERGDHVALVGPNGSGKTTFLEAIVAGRFKLGYGVEPAYFSQHTVDIDDRGSVLDCVQGTTGLTRPKAQALLGRFLFSGWEAHEKAVSALSGGERRRLALALLVASGANFLVLDEPTNHLDLESREALEEALEIFPGTILLVSHDRALLDAVAHRTAAIEDGTIRTYQGGWADLLRVRAEREASTDPAPVRSARSVTKRPAASAPDALERLEQEVERQERVLGALEAKLAHDWADAQAVAEHRRAREELRALVSRWEELVDEAPPS
jgi:ATP-binding cassette subfamily F protein 3